MTEDNGVIEDIDFVETNLFAKNLTIAKFFREIGYTDELGSGFVKITKNSLLYSGKQPIFEDYIIR